MLRINPIDEWTEATVPEPGEPVRSGGLLGALEGAVRPGYQALLNRCERLLRNQVLAPLPQLPWMRCADGVHIEVGPIQDAIFATGERISTAAPVTPPIPAGIDGWKYVYCRAVSGVLTFTVEDVAPDVYLVAKTGDTARRYVGCALQVLGQIVPFERRGRRYTYDGYQAVGPPAAPATYTPLSVAAYVPPHSRYARLWLRQVSSDAGPSELSIRRSGALAVGNEYVLRAEQAVTGGTTVAAAPLEIGLDASQRIEYRVTGLGAGNASIAVAGFEE